MLFNGRTWSWSHAVFVSSMVQLVTAVTCPNGENCGSCVDASTGGCATCLVGYKFSAGVGSTCVATGGFFSWPRVIFGLFALYLLYYFFGPEGNKATTVPFDDSIATLETILDQWKPQLGGAYQGYRNHCYRVFHFIKALSPAPFTAEQAEQVVIAVAHHDVGIWTNKLKDGRPNIDYIDPSVHRAVEWLKANKKPDTWITPVSLMVSEHHKLTRFQADTPELQRLVETFRKADLVDFSLGVIRNGLSRKLVASVRHHWPNAGFHRGLVTIICDRLRTHPLNPLPMMKL